MRDSILFICCLTFLSFMPWAKKITVFSIVDSTMAEYNIGKESREYGGKNYPIRGLMQLAKQMKIPLIDFNRKSTEFIEALGDEKSKELYLYIKPGVYKKLPNINVI